jgi:thioredoxin reductase
LYDVIIVGGGPAGMSAALTLGRVRRSVLLVDAGQGRNAPAAAVHNFLTRDGTPPAELRELGREELTSYPTVEIREATVTSASGDAGAGFQLALSDGGAAVARRLLLATGLVDEMPDLHGVESLWGRSAFHCPYCHGFECAGLPTAVTGATGPRVRLALQLRRITDDVVLCTGGELLDQATHDLLAAAGVAVRSEPLSRLEGTDGRLERIVFDGGEPLPRRAVFVQNRPRQRSGLAGRLGCAILPDGCVEVGEFGQTSVPGVYAAGDMARRAAVPLPLAAVVAAAASGGLAGGVIDQDLLSVEHALPNPFAKAEGANHGG